MAEATLDHESRISRIEGIAEQVNVRLDRIERDLRWAIGLQVGGLLATAGILIKLFLP